MGCRYLCSMPCCGTAVQPALGLSRLQEEQCIFNYVEVHTTLNPWKDGCKAPPKPLTTMGR